jgi:hypothetical protein
MKPGLSLIALLLIKQLTYCQQNILTGSINENKVVGNIVIPTLQSLTIKTTSNAPLQFSTGDEFSNPKILNKFYTIVVKSNVPWTVSVEPASDLKDGSLLQSEGVFPANLISLKKSAENTFITLTGNQQELLKSDNNNIINIYSLDVRINPGWKYAGGFYSLGLVFTLTPQ